MSDLNMADHRSLSPENSPLFKPLSIIDLAKIGSITQQTKATLKQRMPKRNQLKVTSLKPERTKMNLVDDSKDPISD